MKAEINKQMNERTSSQAGLKASLKDASKRLDDVQSTVSDLHSQVVALQEELNVVETEAFKAFCKKVKVKTIQEYETRTNGGGGADTTFDQKCELEQLIQKNENQIEIIESHLTFKQLEALKQSLIEEQDKLEKLLAKGGETDQINPLGSLIGDADAVARKQEELKELELEQATLDKDKSAKTARSNKLKEDLQKLASRLDGLVRTQNLNRMQLRNIRNQIRQKMEEAQLNMTPTGLEDDFAEKIQSQLLDEDFNHVDIVTNLVDHLLNKVDEVNSPLELKTVDQITQIQGSMRQKLVGLQKQEDEYNANVQVVVESDEEQLKLNEVISSLRKEIEEISARLEKAQRDFREVRTSRKDKFLSFFDGVANKVGETYRKLTQGDITADNGHASLTLLDREQPFGDETTENNIIYEFKPPNKQFDSDINARSGGEKTIAGLALIFTLAMLRRPIPPPFILLDEVDAHLDNENVALLSSFLETWTDSPQIMMISHKEEAVAKSQSLIGVTHQEYYRVPAEGASDDQTGLEKNKYVSAVTFSVDMSKY
jgi:chromosome segregation ATPase